MADKKILVVDDSATMRMLIVMTIKKSLPGISVIEAVDGNDAVDKLKANDVDIILTDINMPNMDGNELIKWVRESHSNDIPIIVITTEGDEQGMEERKALGANDYITKPIKGPQLKEIVQEFLS
jgi:CheY-like chemotaxis protein